MKSNHKTAVGKVLRKAFGNLQVEDAKVPLLLIPTEVDFKNAIQKDPKNCGLSRCVGRMFGATLALFFKRCAYVDIVGEDGIRRVYRYAIGRNPLSQIAAFDRGNPLKLGRSITLTPPSPMRTLAGERRRNRQWRRSDVGKALKAERKAQSNLRAASGEAQRAQEQFDRMKARHGASSPILLLARKQADVARTQLREAREQVNTTAARAKEFRTKAFRSNSPPKPRHYDLTVRNASGFFSRLGAA